ncbi:hypothetical protein BJX96DRAFT_158578 [Aspergillus floccosus]
MPVASFPDNSKIPPNGDSNNGQPAGLVVLVFSSTFFFSVLSRVESCVCLLLD